MLAGLSLMSILTRRDLLNGFLAGGLTFVARRVQAEPVQPDLSHLTPEQRERYEQMYARMMAAFAFERITVAGKDAFAEWQRLKSENRGSPVVVGSDADLERLADQFSMFDPNVSGVATPGLELRDPGQILSAASKLTFPAGLRLWSGAYQPNDLRAPLGKWPSKVDVEGAGLSVAIDLVSGRFHGRVHILLIPTKFSWEIPAYLRWGDWNACPPPEYHVAALRSWHERYGVELVGINGDTMNLLAASRPKTRPLAIDFAREQYGYCPDIVDQGVGSISALAATLMASDWWYLWWD